jgi:ABC-2 type transport system ATP-binding protein
MVSVEGVSKRFESRQGSVDAVRDVSFSIDEGEIFGLLGPNGAGKTTTVLMLATLLLPSGGRASVAGSDVAQDAEAVRKLLGVAFQHTGIDLVQTGRELLELHGQLYGMERVESRVRAGELLDFFGLEEAADRRLSTYSAGMQRRLDLALALVHDPRVVLLDEPTTGLDPASRLAVWEEIRELGRQGVTVLLTTQYLEEADRLADRVAIIDEGVVVADGSPEQLKRSLGGDVIELVFRDEAESASAASVIGDGASAEGVLVRLRAKDGAARVPGVVQALQQAGITPVRLSVTEPTLDEVFLRVTGNRLAAESFEAEPAQSADS